MAKGKKEELEEIPELEADVGEVLAGWEIPEFTKPKRSKKWYLYFAGILILFIILSTLNADIPLFNYGENTFDLSFDSSPLFIAIIALFIILYWYIGKKEPRQLDFVLSEDGIIIGQKFIEYSILSDFYIIYQPPRIKNLYLEPKNIVKPTIVIPLLDQNPVEIRKTLLEYLPEDLEKEEIPATESISEVLKL